MGGIPCPRMIEGGKGHACSKAAGSPLHPLAPQTPSRLFGASHQGDAGLGLHCLHGAQGCVEARRERELKNAQALSRKGTRVRGLVISGARQGGRDAASSSLHECKKARTKEERRR